MGTRVIHTCDICSADIKESSAVETGHDCEAFNIEFNATVSGFVSGHHSTGHWSRERDLLVCRSCFYGGIKKALKVLGFEMH